MKVRDLIERLKSFDQDLEVIVEQGSEYYTKDIQFNTDGKAYRKYGGFENSDDERYIIPDRCLIIGDFHEWRGSDDRDNT